MKRWMVIFLTVGLACGGDESPSEPNDQHDDLGEEGLSGRQGCIEETKPLGTDEASSEFAEAEELLGLLTGEHKADLHWHDGQETEVSATVANARAVKVESREDPDFLLDIGRNCVDRVRIELDLLLTSDDGRLNESFPRAVFERGETAVLSTWIHLKTAEMHGAYVRQVAGAGELSAVYFSVEFGEHFFQGDVSEETTGEGSTSLSASVGTWSAQ